MPNPFTIWYKKPKSYERNVETFDLPDTFRTITTTTEDKLKNAFLSIPISPYFHTEGLQRLIKKVDGSSISVMLALITGLHERKQHNIVTASILDIAVITGLSERTVVSSIKRLTVTGFILKTGKQDYHISPKIAWFGNQVDWAVALDKLNKEEQW